MLYIKYSPDWKQNAALAIREVCDGAARGETGQILIVPEQNSFDAEWRLCAEGGETISRFAEVLSFTRLAGRVFIAEGGAAVPTLDRSGRLIAMAGAMELLRPQLKRYARQIARPEFLLQLLQTVDEFHSYGLTPAAVRAAAGELPPLLSEKLGELVLILETYDAVCARARQDPSTRLTRLRDSLADSDWARGRKIVVEGFTDFTAQELDVLELLARQADRVTVYLTLDTLDRGQSVFSIPRKTAIHLRERAKRRNVRFRAAALLVPREETPLRHLAHALFAPGLPVWEGPAPLWLSKQETVWDECLAAAGQIQTQMQAGRRWREFAVGYTDEAVYRPVLETLLSRYEIPAYFSGSRELLCQSVIRAVVYALEAAACGMEPQSVAEYLKSGFAPVTEHQADALENYGFVWRLRGSGWEKEFTRDPQGLQKDDRRDEAALAAALASLNEARRAAIAPLAALRAGLQAAKDTGEQVRALDDFLTTIGLADRLHERADEFTARGDLQRAQEFSQLYDLLLDTMEQIYGVLGTSVRTPEEFYRFFRAALSQCAVGTIPANLDCVRVGSLTDLRHVDVPVLLVLGASDGLLPHGGGGGGLISDAERETMQAAGLPVAASGLDRVDRELLTAWTVFTAPTEALTVCCQREAPSYLFTRLEKLFPQACHTLPLPQPVRPDQAAALAVGLDPAQRAGLLEALPSLREPCQTLLARAGKTLDRLDPATVTALYGETLDLSSSKLDRFAGCQLSYFLRYGLKAEERKEARVDASLYGVFVHYVMQHTAQQVQQEGGFHILSLDRVLEIAGDFCEAFTAEHLADLEAQSPRELYLFRRNFREVYALVRELYAELSRSNFIPTSFELEFQGRTAIPIQGDTASATLRGAVDRVDLYHAPDGETFVRVVDYKTGKKDFDYTDILCGMGLQMLLYLFVLTQQAQTLYHEDLQPAGVQYFPARYDVEPTKGRLGAEAVEKERRSKLVRKGLVLGEEDVLWAMEPESEPTRLPVKRVKKTGTLGGDVATRVQLETVQQHVQRVVGRFADEIAAGKIAPNPYYRGDEHNACRWCEYKPVCHVNSGEVPLRRLVKLSAEEFWDRLEKEEVHGR